MKIRQVNPHSIQSYLGATAGIAEMLLQSHAGDIHLLPALPSVWPTGYVKGLRARGGFEVDITWKDGELTGATVQSKLGGKCRVRIAMPAQVTSDGRPIKTVSPEENVIEFETETDGIYAVSIAK